MKTFISFIFFFLLFSISVLASTESESNKIALEDILPRHCIFSADFLQTRQIKNLPLPLTSSGKLFFSCEHGLVWNNLDPINETLIYTNSSLNFRVTQALPIETLNGQKHNYLSQLLLALLSNNTQKIMKEFTITKSSKHPLFTH